MAKTTESADKYKRMKPTINIKTEGFLKKFFIDKQVKQIQVADKIGITRASLGGILSRNGKISIDSFATIADVIGCDMKIVLTDRETGQQWTCDETTRPKAHDENEITEIPEQAENTASEPIKENSRESNTDKDKEDDEKHKTPKPNNPITNRSPNSREEIEAMFAKMSEKNKVSEPRKKNGYKMHSLTGEEAEPIYSRTDVEEKIEQEKKRK